MPRPPLPETERLGRAIQTRLRPDLRAAAERRAAELGRTLAEHVRELLEEDLRRADRERRRRRRT